MPVPRVRERLAERRASFVDATELFEQGTAHHMCVRVVGAQTNPLEGTPAIRTCASQSCATALGPWHTKLMVIVDGLLRR